MPPLVETTTRLRLWLQFVLGLGWLAFVAAGFSAWTRQSFWAIFVVLLTTAVFASLLALICLARWAMRNESRTDQFGIGTLLLVVGYAAVYFALVRWLVENLGQSPLANVWATPADAASAGLYVAIFCLALLCVSIPFVLALLESLMWLVVWLVRRPWLRPLLNALRRRR